MKFEVIQPKRTWYIKMLLIFICIFSFTCLERIAKFQTALEIIGKSPRDLRQSFLTVNNASFSDLENF